MGRAADWLNAWLVLPGLAMVIAWSVLAIDGSDLTWPALCSAGPLLAMPPPVSFKLTFDSSARLAFGWAIMIVGMMSPLIIAPLRHVYDRSFARRRPRAMILFLVGYTAVWMVAGIGLQAMALAARWAAAPMVCFSLTAAVAMLWQVSPVKQWCLNRCHRHPPLAAFGASADRDSFDFGLMNGASCAGACWALMLLPLVVGQGHLLGMIAVMLFVAAERLEPPIRPAWRLRGPRKALRIFRAQAHIRLFVLICTRNPSREARAAY